MSLLATLDLLPPNGDACNQCASLATVGVIDVTPGTDEYIAKTYPMLTGFELAFCQSCRAKVFRSALSLLHYDIS